MTAGIYIVVTTERGQLTVDGPLENLEHLLSAIFKTNGASMVPLAPCTFDVREKEAVHA